MYKHTVEKYFNNTCTAEEAEQVVEWLATEEGQAYLSARLDEDAALFKNEKVKPMLPALDSAKIWNNIEGEFDSTKKHRMPDHHHDHFSSYWYVAAMILLVCGLSFFFYGKYFSAKTTQKQQLIYFITNAQQKKEITLSDGTEIILNSNSQLKISATYGLQKREVTLKGEAYFEVTHNPAKPFVIHTQGILIKDLGTAFNVRAIRGKKNVQVAVKRGKVSILYEDDSPTVENPVMEGVKLIRGQYAYVDLKTSSISINEFEVENYFSWMSDRLMFDNATLAKASKQLNHIYNVTFSYAADSLKAITFSAKFEKESLKRTLEVIALTLSIDYQMKNNYVIWKVKETK